MAEKAGWDKDTYLRHTVLGGWYFVSRPSSACAGLLLPLAGEPTGTRIYWLALQLHCHYRKRQESDSGGQWAEK